MSDDTGDDPRPFDEADDIATNDAVAGETVWPGAGDGNDGPTGGSPAEGEPDWEHYAPDRSGPDESQPFGDKAPDDLRITDE